MNWKNQVKKLLLFDLRSFAVLRCGTAFIVILDLLLRLRDFDAHYANSGILPLNVLFQYLWNDFYFSFFNISSGYGFALFLFCINLILALFLFLGYKTKWVSVLCWIMMVSLHNRNPLVLQGGDDLLRMILFWGMFLPWGRVWSVDSLKTEEVADYKIFSIAGFGYMLQIGAVYFFSALLKSSPEWTSEFTAVYYALSLDQMVYPLGKLIYPYPELLRFLTATVWFLELLVPLLLVIPYAVNSLRIGFVVLIFVLHLGISLMLNVGLFPVIGSISLIGLLPGSILDKRTYIRKAGEMFKESKMIKASSAFFICIVLLSNVLSVTKNITLQKFYPSSLGNILRVNQNWGMFAPSVFKDDGWFVLIADGDSGEKDIYRGGIQVSLEKPEKVYATVPTDRWRKYQENILMIHNSHLRPFYCDYLVREWNKRNTDKIKNLKIVYMKEFTLPDYQVEGPSYELLYECTCQNQ